MVGVRAALSRAFPVRIVVAAAEARAVPTGIGAPATGSAGGTFVLSPPGVRGLYMCSRGSSGSRLHRLVMTQAGQLHERAAHDGEILRPACFLRGLVD